MLIGFYPGSFDPPTFGHLDIIQQALRFCTHLIIGIGVHTQKTACLEPEERAALLQSLRPELLRDTSSSTLEIIVFSGLTVETAQSHGAHLLIRGLRNSTDFDYEMQMAHTNRMMAPEIQTLFLPSSPHLSPISSTFIRQVASLKGDVTPFVPQQVALSLRKKFS